MLGVNRCEAGASRCAELMRASLCAGASRCEAASLECVSQCEPHQPSVVRAWQTVANLCEAHLVVKAWQTVASRCEALCRVERVSPFQVENLVISIGEVYPSLAVRLRTAANPSSEASRPRRSAFSAQTVARAWPEVVANRWRDRAPREATAARAWLEAAARAWHRVGVKVWPEAATNPWPGGKAWLAQEPWPRGWPQCKRRRTSTMATK